MASLVGKEDAAEVLVKKAKCHLIAGLDLNTYFCPIKCPLDGLVEEEAIAGVVDVG
jgi:hypothetical protein